MYIMLQGIRLLDRVWQDSSSPFLWKNLCPGFAWILVCNIIIHSDFDHSFIVIIVWKEASYALLKFCCFLSSLPVNAEIMPLFEGEPGHLVPSASPFLLNSDMFIVAGRIVGHSFLHGGLRLSGLSRAVVHMLVDGSLETATVHLEDCPDLDIRETIRLVCSML